MAAASLFAFAGSYFLIALSPGLCMSLSMSLGIAIGVRRTVPMMIGELAGIGLSVLIVKDGEPLDHDVR